MSRIIKNGNAVFSQPILIEPFRFMEISEEVPICEYEEIDEPSAEEKNDELEIAQREFERLKEESQLILTETEQMVMELLQKARDEARSILSGAQEEAELVRSQAEEEAQQIRKRAFEEAYAEGLKKAQLDIEEDRQAALQQSAEIIEEARQTKIQIMRSCESDMVRLVMAVAKKVIASELTTNPDIIINVLRESISYLDKPDNIMVYVNPRDLERLLDVTKTETFFDIGTNDVNLNFQGDDRISPGGCSLESEGGSVDTRLETRIAAVEQALQEVSGDE